MTNKEKILAATKGNEIFGNNAKRAKIVYRRLARSVHPDMFSEQSEKEEAEQVFKKLSVLWEAYTRGSTVASPGSSPARAKKNSVKTSKREYQLGSGIAADPFFKRFEATYDDGHAIANILITSDPGNNDLAENYVENIRTLVKEVPEEYKGFYPEIVETFQHVSDGASRVGIVQTFHEGLVPFSKILERYPDGIGGRDVAWIFRRMLIAVGNAHDAGFIHGGINLDSLFIQPEQHGVVLGDWQYSVAKGEKLVAVPANWKSDYPDNYLAGDPVSESIDIMMCGKVAERLLRNEPSAKRMRNFLKVVSKENAFTAQRLFGEFDILIRGMYGEPKFHPFTLK